MAIVALVSDLIFQSKIAGTASHLGIEVRTFRSSEAALEAAQSAAALLVDLNAEQESPLDLIRRVKADCPAVTIVAFVSHVQVDLAREAKAAGADQVLARSKFTEQLPELLQQLVRD